MAIDSKDVGARMGGFLEEYDLRTPGYYALRSTYKDTKDHNRANLFMYGLPGVCNPFFPLNVL